MPCFLNDGNCNTFPHNGNGWHNGGGPDVCTHHYQALAADLTNNGALTFSQGRLNDYIKIGLLMRDSNRVTLELQKLNDAMSMPVLAHLDQAGSGPYVKLSQALAHYESICWFPSVHMVLVGLLPGADFLSLLRSGIPVKDVGAGANHGEFSHRLQWFAIMRIATNGFATAVANGWSTSPYDLYCSFGEDPALARNAWGALLDDQSRTDCRNPAHLDGMIRQSLTMQNLRQKLSSVRTKRIAVSNAAGKFGFDQVQKEVPVPTPPRNMRALAMRRLGDNYISQITGAQYTAHKGIGIKGTTIGSQQGNVLADNPSLLPTDFDPGQAFPVTPAIDVLKELDIYEKPRWNQKPRFSVCMSNGALIRTGERLPTPEQVQLRRIKSRVSLHS
jgi:hypothetical protein